MNCISIAVYPQEADAAIKRVVEYFYPGDRGKVWVDIFVHNPTGGNLTLRILHAGSLTAQDVTEDSWVREHALNDHCAAVLTRRIMKLHDERYLPIKIERSRRCVQLGEEEYKAWAGSVSTIIGGNPNADVPFTVWEVAPLYPGKSVLRLCLEMHEETYKRRFGDKTSFFAHGEAIVLRNIEYGDLPSYNGSHAERYREEFAKFKGGHKVPEGFEYLIVSPDRRELLWDAIALSPLIVPKFIASDELAKTTQWFAVDSSHVDNWELKADFVVEISKVDATHENAA